MSKTTELYFEHTALITPDQFSYIMDLLTDPKTTDIMEGLIWYFGQDAKVWDWLNSPCQGLSSLPPIVCIGAGMEEEVMELVTNLIAEDYLAN